MIRIERKIQKNPFTILQVDICSYDSTKRISKQIENSATNEFVQMYPVLE
jgi:disulfide oxidoreductase YuzD